MSNQRLASILIEIGQATKEPVKGADALSFSGTDSPTHLPHHITPEYLHGLYSLCLTHQIYPRLSHEKVSHPMSIFMIAGMLEHVNRNLVSLSCEIGKGLELYDTNHKGRAILVTTTPTFDIWKGIVKRQFKPVSAFVDYLARQTQHSPVDVRHSLSELKQAFFIAHTLESDVLIKRRYEILADLTLRALNSSQPELILKDVKEKLDMMEEMKQIDSDELLKDFKITESEGRVSIDWTESGSAEDYRKRSSKRNKPTTFTGS